MSMLPLLFIKTIESGRFLLPYTAKTGQVFSPKPFLRTELSFLSWIHLSPEIALKRLASQSHVGYAMNGVTTTYTWLWYGQCFSCVHQTHTLFISVPSPAVWWAEVSCSTGDGRKALPESNSFIKAWSLASSLPGNLKATSGSWVISGIPRQLLLNINIFPVAVPREELRNAECRTSICRSGERAEGESCLPCIQPTKLEPPHPRISKHC